MGNTHSICKVNYEDIQYIIVNKSALLINTLDCNKQDCLIKESLTANSEVETLNLYLTNGTSDIRIIIYGENSSDDSIIKKFKQLTSLGFTNVYLYVGGLFEWLLLQDIYGYELFPTTKKERDILKFKGKKVLGIKLIEG
jgi:hypothetical protein